MTRNPNPTDTKGFGARVGAEAGGAGAPLFPWGLRLPLIHAHSSGGASLPITANLCSPRTGPHIPQAILTMTRAPGQPCPGAGEWLLFSAVKQKLFSVEISPSLLHSPVSVGYSRVLLKSFCAWGMCRAPLSVCVLLRLING